MNYHSNSDVPVPYGRVVSKESTGLEKEAEGGLKDFHRVKKRGVALLASNCGGPSGRYNYLDR